MKRLVFIFAFLLCCSAIQVQARGIMTMCGAGVPVAGGPCTGSNPNDCTFRETFNGAVECADGYSSTCNNAWVIATFTPDFDNTSYPASGATYATYLTGNGTIRNSTNHSALAEGYYVVRAYIETRAYASTFMKATTSTAGTLCTMIMGTNGEMSMVNDQSETSSTIATVSNGGVYYFKLRYKKGSGENSECEGWVSSDGVNWGTSQSTAGGAVTTDAARVYIGTGTNTKSHIQEVRIYSGDISW